ncbi:MAG: hypothetical protein HC865_00275 [Cyanobacteria bacterium RU_5_0]|nr:hypothetical protein [Cyanobacteria bacterium RU_5_0]
MAGALIGIGGIAFLFGEVVKYQAEEQIQQTLRDRSNLLNNTLNQSELYADTVRTSILTLHIQNAEFAETYRRLLFELFKDRPDFVVGLGFGQSQNGVLPQAQWFSPYYHLDSGEPDAVGLQLPPPYDMIRYIDGTKPDTFYPETDRYQKYFLPEKNIWSQPEQQGEKIQITYYSQILDSEKTWLGTVFVDVDSTSLKNTINGSVLHGAGYFALLTENGQIISYPAKQGSETGTYRSIPGLEKVWFQMKGESGVVEGEHGYWAYQRIEGNWITLAFVPYEAVFNQVALITIGGTLIVALLLAFIVFLTVRSLNRRLRPILDDCDRFAATDAPILSSFQHQDEIGQLSTSFSHLLEQIKINEAQIRQEVALIVQTKEQLKQAEVAEQESQILQAEVEHILNVMTTIEDGNLTVEAQVSPRMTGLVADTLNRVIERLEHVMAIVLNTTQHITQGAKQLEQLAIAVTENTQHQTQSITQVQTLLENVDRLSQDATLQAVATGEAVQSTQVAIQQGQQEITTISKGIDVLQQSTNQITKRTQTLTNYVELAVQFAKNQKRIAAMTRILAVNATMLANRAAAQEDPEQFASITREFETVASQVNDLAIQTNQSLVLLQQRTDRIQTVVSGLDHDVQEISQQVNDFTMGVDQSLQVFDTIQSVSEQVAQMGQRVIQSNQAIVEATQTTLESVQGISAIATETLNQSDMTQERAKQIQKFAHLLLQNIEFFKLHPNHYQVLDSEEPSLQTFPSASAVKPKTISTETQRHSAITLTVLSDPCPPA